MVPDEVARIDFRREQATKLVAAEVLRNVVEAVPSKIYTLWPTNDIRSADLPKNGSGLTANLSLHVFDGIYRNRGIDLRLTKPYDRPTTIRPNG